MVAHLITESVPVPTIGIGAGPHCDGQVLVFHDVLGLEDRDPPKFVRRYASLKADAVAGLRAWAADVRSGAFPSDAETYHITRDLAADAGLDLIAGPSGPPSRPPATWMRPAFCAYVLIGGWA